MSGIHESHIQGEESSLSALQQCIIRIQGKTVSGLCVALGSVAVSESFFQLERVVMKA